MADSRFKALRQQHAHPVRHFTVAPDAQGGQRIGKLICPCAQIAEAELMDGALVADINNGQPVGIAIGPFVTDIRPNIVAFRDLPAKAVANLLECRLRRQHPAPCCPLPPAGLEGLPRPGAASSQILIAC